jgi:hypothetical protein
MLIFGTVHVVVQFPVSECFFLCTAIEEGLQADWRELNPDHKNCRQWSVSKHFSSVGEKGPPLERMGSRGAGECKEFQLPYLSDILEGFLTSYCFTGEQLILNAGRSTCYSLSLYYMCCLAACFRVWLLWVPNLCLLLLLLLLSKLIQN